MKKVDFKDGKFVVETESEFLINGAKAQRVIVDECIKRDEELVTNQDVMDYLDEKECDEAEESRLSLMEQVIDESKNFAKKFVEENPLPKELQVIIGMSGELHIRLDINGWKKLTREQSVSLAQTIMMLTEEQVIKESQAESKQ